MLGSPRVNLISPFWNPTCHLPNSDLCIFVTFVFAYSTFFNVHTVKSTFFGTQSVSFNKVVQLCNYHHN